MMHLTGDDVSTDDLSALESLCWSMPDGELREALAYMHDALARDNSVVVGVIEGGA
jgi:hypothetical protein